MKIHIEVENDETITPLKFATELIRMETEGTSLCGFDAGISWLEEIGEYIITFTKHNRRIRKVE